MSVVFFILATGHTTNQLSKNKNILSKKQLPNVGKTAKKRRGIVNELTIFGVHIILYIIYAKYGEVFMEAYKVIEIKKSVFESNDREAEKLRAELKAEKTFLVNLMSSPGSGKTTTLRGIIGRLQQEMRMGVMEADIDSDVDAKTIAETGVRAIQLHTGGMCHLDAGMTRQGVENLGTADLDLVFLENVGNLVCPAEFDTGAAKNMMILSVPEGDDKPLKYPLMFTVSDVVLINKIDTKSVFDFDDQAVQERILKLNPQAKIFFISAKTGEGMDAVCDWLRQQVRDWNA